MRAKPLSPLWEHGRSCTQAVGLQGSVAMAEHDRCARRRCAGTRCRSRPAEKVREQKGRDEMIGDGSLEEF